MKNLISTKKKYLFWICKIVKAWIFARKKWIFNRLKDYFSLKVWILADPIVKKYSSTKPLISLGVRELSKCCLSYWENFTTYGLCVGSSVTRRASTRSVERQAGRALRSDKWLREVLTIFLCWERVAEWSRLRACNS